VRAELTAWNVGHGEALRIDFESGPSVVRDFGRHRLAKPTTTSVKVDDVIATPLVMPNRRAIAILSHAHEDHFNGFREMYRRGQRRVFSECYIPWLDFDTADALGWQVEMLGLYLFAYYGEESPAALTTRNWSQAAPLMAALGANLSGVVAECPLQWAEAEAKVLWPPPPTQTAWWGGHKRLIGRTLTSIRSQLRKTDQGEVVEVVENSAEVISAILRKYYNPEHIAVRFEEGSVKRDLGTIESQLRLVGELEVGHNLTLDRSFSAGAANRRSFMDDHSMVFEIGRRALLLSDLHGASMDMMARLYMPRTRRYAFMKSAHHGTRLGHLEFRKAVSGVRDILHCCGPASRAFHAPINDYSCFAPKRIISTDHHPQESPAIDGIPRLVFGTQQMTFEL
jgi:hypothetical protein